MDVNENKGVWLIDPVHTKIRFETKYLMITSVSGWFTQFEGTVTTPTNDFNNSDIRLTVYTASLYTGNQERDNHLRSPDFFNTKQFPTLTFRSTVIKVADKKVNVIGDLRIKNITETIRFDAAFIGCVRDPIGNLKAGFEISLTLNRKDFDISWNQFFDKAGVLVSDEVKIFCDVQLLKAS
ncbi:MAG TPA: YceI family protein [Flavisolibacter sp.]|nr:YceI family protein [Flavisolibacter sp.]